MNDRYLADRRSFLRNVGAGLGLGLAGPMGALALPGGSRPGEPSPGVRYRWVSVREVHGDGTHNAWPDICRWQGRYYVAFNSGGQNHGGGHGLTVLSSADGLNWETVLHKPAGEWGVLENTTRTTVCPKFLPLKDRLILVFYFYTAGDTNVSPQRKADLKRRWLGLKGSEESFERWVGHHSTSFRTGVSYSEDGRRFEDPEPLLDASWRVWRPQTFKGRHYIVGYRCHGQEWAFSPELESMIPEADTFEMFESASLFSSADGLSWAKVSDIAAEDNDETDFDFAPDGRILAVSRKGASSKLHPGARPGSRHAPRLPQPSALSELAPAAPGSHDPGPGGALGRGSMDGRRPAISTGTPSRLTRTAPTILTRRSATGPACGLWRIGPAPSPRRSPCPVGETVPIRA